MMHRLQRIQKTLYRLNLDSLLITDQHNVSYLTLFPGLSNHEREGYLLITKKSAKLLTFPTTFGLYQKGGKGFTTHCITQDKRISDYISFSIQQERLKNVGFEETSLTVSELNNLKRKIPVTWLPTKELVENFRIVKDNDEIECIKRAALIGDKAFEFILTKIQKGITEKKLSLELEYFLKSHADDVSFSPIVAFNKHAAIPHYLPSDYARLSQKSLILLDFGAKVHGYCSDMTRVVFFGKPDEEMVKTYNTVIEAQKRAMETLKVGTACEDADRRAKTYISSCNYPSYLHGLGHGVGMAIHEAPRLKEGVKEKLAKHMVVTVEPGIYLEGRYGVRIEDLVVLTGNGVEVLTKSTKEIIVLG